MNKINKIVEEIVEVLQTSPARLAKVYFAANVIVKKNNTVFIQITTTFNNNIKTFNLQKIKESINNINKLQYKIRKKIIDDYEEGIFEKFHQTGLALGTLEYYLTSKNLNYSKTFQYLNNEVITEYNITCPT